MLMIRNVKVVIDGSAEMENKNLPPVVISSTQTALLCKPIARRVYTIASIIFQHKPLRCSPINFIQRLFFSQPSFTE